MRDAFFDFGCLTRMAAFQALSASDSRRVNRPMRCLAISPLSSKESCFPKYTYTESLFGSRFTYVIRSTLKPMRPPSPKKKFAIDTLLRTEIERGFGRIGCCL